MALLNTDPWSQRSNVGSLTLHELTRRLDLIAARVPLMVYEYPDAQEFRKAFATDTDCLFETAGEHYDLVRVRIDKMLADTGMIPNAGDGLESDKNNRCNLDQHAVIESGAGAGIEPA